MLWLKGLPKIEGARHQYYPGRRLFARLCLRGIARRGLFMLAGKETHRLTTVEERQRVILKRLLHHRSEPRLLGRITSTGAVRRNSNGTGAGLCFEPC